VLKKWDKLQAYGRTYHEFDKNWDAYKKYKKTIPSFGCILLNKTLDKIVFGKALLTLK